MSAHGYDKKVFPLTAAQGRVLYHIERVFRSTGGGQKAYWRFLSACERAGYDGHHVERYTTAQCVEILRLIEWAAHAAGLGNFRPIRTGWQDFKPSHSSVRIIGVLYFIDREGERVAERPLPARVSPRELPPRDTFATMYCAGCEEN
jgi:hypothetical protein